MEYLTDGEHLYERVSERVVQNAGLGGCTIHYLIVLDCKTFQMDTLREAQIADLRVVQPAEAIDG